MNVPPVIRRSVSGIDPERLDGIDRLQHFLDLRPAAEPEQAFSAGSHIGYVEKRSPGPTARKMSMRETTVL